MLTVRGLPTDRHQAETCHSCLTQVSEVRVYWTKRRSIYLCADCARELHRRLARRLQIKLEVQP